MRIVFICGEYPPLSHGGIGSYVQSIAQYLGKSGHSVRVVGLCDLGRNREDGSVRIIELRRWRVRVFSWLLNRIRLYIRLVYMMWSEPFDILEVPDYQGWLPFPWPFSPVVVRLHLSETTIMLRCNVRPDPLTRLCEYWTLRLHRHWVAVSNYSLAITIKTFGVKPLTAPVIHYPVEEFGDVAVGMPSPCILYAGSLIPRKGVFILAKAATPVLRDFPEMHLVFVGRERGGVSHQVSSLVDSSCRNRVHFLGEVTRQHLFSMMRHAEVFCLPSTLETFGLVVAEAMLAGCAVVTSARAPFTEFVTDGLSGLLVDPESAVEVEAALRKLLSQKSLRDSLARKGQETIREHFHPREIARQNLLYYSSLARTARVS